MLSFLPLLDWWVRKVRGDRGDGEKVVSARPVPLHNGLLWGMDNACRRSPLSLLSVSLLRSLTKTDELPQSSCGLYYGWPDGGRSTSSM